MIPIALGDGASPIPIPFPMMSAVPNAVCRREIIVNRNAVESD